MKVAIAMMYDGNVPFGPAVEEINRAYAQARGYDFICYRHFPDPQIGPFWNRIRLFQQELDRYDVIWWVDADAFFLQQEAYLPVVTHDLTLSGDWNGICCGVMAVRSSSWTRRFLDAWLLLDNVRADRIEKFDNGQFREQTTLKALCYHWPMVECHTTKVSEMVVQCPTSQFWHKALILHMWNGWIGPERAVRTVEKFKAEGRFTEQTLQRP